MKNTVLTPALTGISTFRFKDTCSSDLGIIITKTPEEKIPERDVETISVPGRNGDLVFDKGRYNNVPREYSCAVLPELIQNQTDYLMAVLSGDMDVWTETDSAYLLELSKVIQLLSPTAQYFRLEDSYDPRIYRMARVSGGISVENIVNQAGIFSVEFDCKPQKFLISGDVPKIFTEATPQINRFLFNFSEQTAKPLIRVTGSGAGDISVGGINVELKDLTDPITLDCEMQNAYGQTGDGPLVNKNAVIYAPEFPQLPPGSCAVSWSGGVERVEIIPRWWTL